MTSGHRAQAAGGEVGLNRELRTLANAEYTQAHATRAWACEEMTWGISNIPERQAGVLGDVEGLDVIELGCGTAYFSAWLARRGARPVGVDVTPAQASPTPYCNLAIAAWAQRWPAEELWTARLPT